MTAMLAVATVAEAQQLASIANARDTVLSVMKSDSLPSAAVAVMKDGKIVWEEAFGFADVARGLRATPQTPYSIASVTKPMTATAVMKLAERRALNLNASANSYLGAGKLTAPQGRANDVTLRALLTHTAGLPLHWHFFYEGESTPPSMDTTIARYGVLVQPPGTEYFYANLGYGVLGHIVERTSGIPFGEFLQQEVFSPLGMRNSHVDPADARGAIPATRYDRARHALPLYNTSHPGASVVYSSAHDLIRFGAFHLRTLPNDQKQILADSSVTAMQRAGMPDSAGNGYGLGWSIDNEWYGHRAVYHAGSAPGSFALLVLFPAERTAIAVTVNAQEGLAAYRILHAAAATVIPNYFADRARAEAATNTPATPSQSKPNPLADLKGSWKGYVLRGADTLSLELTFQPDGDVHVRFQNQLATLLNAVSFDGRVLEGRFVAHLASPDTDSRHHLRLRLIRRGETLSGSAIAVEAIGANYALPFFTTIARTPEAP